MSFCCEVGAEDWGFGRGVLLKSLPILNPPSPLSPLPAHAESVR